MSGTRPRMQKLTAAGKGVEEGYGWSFHLVCFFFFFSFSNSPTAHPEKDGLTLNAPKDEFGGSFLWGNFLNGKVFPVFI